MVLHHVDLHVRDLEAALRLFDALAERLGYRRYGVEHGYVGYDPIGTQRPRLWFTEDPAAAGGSLRLAFGVDSPRAVDEVARAAARHGARNMEGPGFHPEYGPEYYGVFFEDASGNRYEVVSDPVAAPRRRLARVWRARVRPGQVRAYKKYISATGLADYRKTDGNAGAWILTAPGEEYDDVMTVSFWDSREAIIRYSGEPMNRAQYYPEDEKYLLSHPEHVEHFDVD